MPDARKLFEALVREHADMLVAYLTAALGNVPEVDDLFQEAMIVAWRRLDDYDQTRPFSAWLRGIARNLLLAHSRRQSRQPHIPLVLDHLETHLDRLNRQKGDSWQEKLEVLQDCVGRLPGHYRDVVHQKYFRQQALVQVSETLSISVDATKKRLQRARSMILDCLKVKLHLGEA